MPEMPDWHQLDLIEATEEGVCLLSEDRSVFFSNERMTTLVGKPSGDLIGKSFYSFFPGEIHKDLDQAFQTAKEQGKARLNVTILTTTRSEPAPVYLRLVRYSGASEGPGGFYAIMLDLSDLLQALREQENLLERNQELETLATTCPLTGLYNRRYFDHHFEEEMSRARRYQHGLGVAFVDVDHFKQFNDTYGHLAGDRVLCQVADSLRSTLRSTDLVARYGGEEFVALMPEIKPEGALAVGIRMRNRVQTRPVEVEGREVKVTVSIGISCVYPPEVVPDDRELIHRADEALYEAKGAGRNRVVLWGYPVG